jgi:hypothetical protein
VVVVLVVIGFMVLNGFGHIIDWLKARKDRQEDGK